MDRNTLYSFIKNVTPPFLFSIFKRSPMYEVAKHTTKRFTKDKYSPSWHKIELGALKDRELFLDPKGEWQHSMLTGTYDDFFFRYIKRFNLKGRTVFDIGTHVGYHSMYFAELVGKEGRVHAFEPNIFNIERFRLILSRNPDIASCIHIHEVAISNKAGTEEFIFSQNIENGTSSGGFLESSDTHNDKAKYESEGGFNRVSVKTVSLDSLDSIGIKDTPYLIKMDIEGAEYLALDGGKDLIKRCSPIILLEVHSIFNMLKVSQLFKEINYEIELLKEETDGRCYISALPKNKNA